jgi:hypothetical protein
MEIRDPSLIKIIDHLKDVIDNNSKFYEIFKFPDYLLKFSKSSSHTGHFIEYFFCWLNINLKTLSKREPGKQFLKKWEFICMKIIEQANQEILRPHGYQIKLRLEAVKTYRRTKYKVINIPFDNLLLLRELGSYFHNLIHSGKADSYYE